VISLIDSDLKKSTQILEIFLANTYLLALKTQNYHWNVTGPTFIMLHELFGSQYKTLSEAIDEIAERIRMLGERAPATFREFLRLTTLIDSDDIKTAEAMITALLKDHEQIIAELHTALKALDSSEDEGTIDFLIGRLRDHEKTAWMLRSHLPL
jgi:starvation-inducible DNA-binding protein